MRYRFRQLFARLLPLPMLCSDEPPRHSFLSTSVSYFIACSGPDRPGNPNLLSPEQRTSLYNLMQTSLATLLDMVTAPREIVLGLVILSYSPLRSESAIGCVDPWHASLRAYHMAERLGLGEEMIDLSELSGQDEESGPMSDQYRVWMESKLEDICLVSELAGVIGAGERLQAHDAH